MKVGVDAAKIGLKVLGTAAKHIRENQENSKKEKMSAASEKIDVHDINKTVVDAAKLGLEIFGDAAKQMANILENHDDSKKRD